jgi:hypothetical protein
MHLSLSPSLFLSWLVIWSLALICVPDMLCHLYQRPNPTKPPELWTKTNFSLLHKYPISGI